MLSSLGLIPARMNKNFPTINFQGKTSLAPFKQKLDVDVDVDVDGVYSLPRGLPFGGLTKADDLR